MQVLRYWSTDVVNRTSSIGNISIQYTHIIFFFFVKPFPSHIRHFALQCVYNIILWYDVLWRILLLCRCFIWCSYLSINAFCNQRRIVVSWWYSPWTSSVDGVHTYFGTHIRTITAGPLWIPIFLIFYVNSSPGIILYT